MINIKKYLQTALIAIYFILTIYSLSNYYENKLPQDYQERYFSFWSRKDYRESAIYVAEKFKDGDIILHISRSTTMSFIYYHGGTLLPEYGIKINGICNKDWWWLSDKVNYSKIGAKFHNMMKFLEIKEKGDLGSYKRIWLIHSSFSGTPLGQDEVGNRIIDWFNKNFSQKEIKMFEGINIYLFSS